jgi:hypothetical protein
MPTARSDDDDCDAHPGFYTLDGTQHARISTRPQVPRVLRAYSVGSFDWSSRSRLLATCSAKRTHAQPWATIDTGQLHPVGCRPAKAQRAGGDPGRPAPRWATRAAAFSEQGSHGRMSSLSKAQAPTPLAYVVRLTIVLGASGQE